MADEATVKKAIAVLIAAYPGAANRDGMDKFLRLLEQLLRGYQPQILEDIAHVRRGLPAQHKFFPSIAEVKEWCDRRAAELWREASREEALERQFQNRLLYGRTEREEELTASEIAERRAKVSSLFKELAADLRTNPSDQGGRLLNKIEEREQAERWLASQAERAKTDKPPMLSERARKLIRRGADGDL